MNLKNVVIASSLSCSSALLAGAASADDLDTQIKALSAIRQAAADICSTVEKEGRSQSLELSGDVKAKLAGVFAKVADLGLEGAGKFASSQYQNVLHQDLAMTLQKSADCRLSVLTLLQEKMITPRTSPGGASPR
jgi:hypothetical protein